MYGYGDRMEQNLQQLSLPMVLVDDYAYPIITIRWHPTTFGERYKPRHLIENGHCHIEMIGFHIEGYPSLAER